MLLIRYRTGDRVHVKKGPCECGRTFLELVVRRFPEVGEFAVASIGVRSSMR